MKRTVVCSVMMTIRTLNTDRIEEEPFNSTRDDPSVSSAFLDIELATQGRRQVQNFGGAIWGSWRRREEDKGTVAVMTCEIFFGGVLLGSAIQNYE